MTQIPWFITFFFVSTTMFCQHRFIENRGQWPEKVQFKTDIGGGSLYLEKRKLTFDRYDREVVSQVFAAHRGEKPLAPPEKLDCHAYQMSFLGANEVEPKGSRAFKTKYAFYLGNRSGKNASAYEEVIYEELYTGIDLKVHSRKHLKYDFAIKPGADPKVIKIRYEGVKPLLRNEGELLLNTSVGKVMESEPFAYQVIDGKIIRIECAYKIDGEIVSFALGNYDSGRELIIDPELIFSTYSGSFSDNFGYTATFDLDEQLYSGSTAFGTQYPVTTGAYQVEWAGGGGGGGLAGTDIAISKFNADGTDFEYSTYLGGSADELPHSLITDSTGVLYILGTTGSDDYPVTENAFQSNFAGGTPTPLPGIGINYANGSDIVVSALSSDGQDLLASTYIGGSANDGTNTATELKYNYADEVRGEIDLDADGNVLVASCTNSGNFPVTEGVFQTTKGNGQDGVFFRLNPLMTNLEVSTFIGGNQEDAVYSIFVSPDGTLTVGGGTSSSDLDMPEGAYQNSYAGGEADGFSMSFSSEATEILNGTYLGTDAYDQIYFVERDESGLPHVFGQTESTSDDLFFNADYGEAGMGMFITKFTADFQSAQWSTTWGNTSGVPPISPVAFAVDICNRIYLSGWGGIVNAQGSTEGLEVTEDALKTTTDGSDFYFLVLSEDASALTFASFFGGDQSAEHVDGGTSRFARGGKIYQAVCAGCGGNDDFPIAPANAVSPTNNSSNCNLGVAKIDFDLPLVLADFETQNVCLPDSVSFTNTSETFSDGNPSYTWTFPNGDTSDLENPSYQFDQPGIYEVELVITDPLSCNLADTLVQEVQVFSALQLEVPEEIINCDSPEFEIEALTGGTANFYTWAEDENFESVISQGETDSILSYNTSEFTTIYLEIDNGLCQQISEIDLAPPLEIQLNTNDTLLCNVEEFEVTFSSNYAPTSIQWNPEEVVIDGENTNTAVLALSDTTVEFSVLVENNYLCTAADTVDLSSYSIELEAPEDTLLCLDEDLSLTANSFGSAEDFTWSNSPDFTNILNPDGDSTITVSPSNTAFYYIRVENNECVLEDTTVVSLLEASTTITSDQYVCAGDTAVIFVSSDFPGNQLSHEWEPSEFIVSGEGTSFIQVIVEEPTTFTVISTTPEGCTTENSTTVFTSPLGGLDVEATASPSNLTLGESSQLNTIPLNDEYLYQWNPSSGLDNPFTANPVASPTESTVYVVTVIDSDDLGFCQKSDSVFVQVFDSFCGSPNIFVPNAFTPNGDGENDVVLVRGGGITDIEFIIYNRWGEEVFRTEDQSAGWDGTYKGDMAEPAVFVYYLEAICDDGQKYTEKGNITLIR